MKIAIGFAMLFVLVGCGTSKYGGHGNWLGAATDSVITTIGRDTYMAKPAPLYENTDYMIQDAGYFCKQQGKELTVTNISYKQIIFTCLSRSDPEYSRPSYQSAPKVIIQDGR